MESEIKLQQVEEKPNYVRISYELRVAGERLRRTLDVDPFDVPSKTEAEIVEMIIANENEDDVNGTLYRMKENKVGRYYPTASGAMVPVGDVDVKVWNGNGVQYAADQIILYRGKMYSVTQAHTSQADWTPDVAQSLFGVAQILGGDTPPEWVQPDGAGGPNLPYAQGVEVTHNGKTWTSDVDNNVWEPGVSQWTEVV